MKEEILKKLKKIEMEKNITVLLAVESGSRAWGQNNEDSDFDIRFIYKPNDISEYLILNKFSDVYEYDDGLLDIVGWDIKKALYLHFKSNPNLREWLISHIVYVPDEIGIFRNLPEFNPEILKHHYYGLAYKTFNKYVKGNPLDDVNIVKKQLYVIRCILAWKSLDKGIMPSMNILDLIENSDLNDELKEAVLNLRSSYSSLTIDEVDEDIFNLIYSWIQESFEEFKKGKVDGPKEILMIIMKDFMRFWELNN